MAAISTFESESNVKTEFIDVSDTRKNLVVEIPSTVVDAEIDKVARDYSRAARIPGFRPGKVPPKVVRQRFRDQILHDVAHGLIPRAVDEALRERGVEPVNTPDIRDVVVEEGQPLKFTASFETVPAIDPGDYSSLTLRRKVAAVDDAAVDQALARLQDRAARYEPVEGRGVDDGRFGRARPQAHGGGARPTMARRPPTARPTPTAMTTSRSTSAPRPIRRASTRRSSGLDAGSAKTFDVQLPVGLRRPGARRHHRDLRRHGQGHPHARRPAARRRAGQGPRVVRVARRAAGAGARRPRARGQARGRARDARRSAAPARHARHLRRPALARRSRDRPPRRGVRAPAGRAADRSQPRPTSTGRSSASGSARRPRKPCAARSCSTRSPRRDGLTATDEEMDAEIERYAERAGRTAAAVRARLEKEGGLARLYTGLRREKTMEFLLSKATVPQRLMHQRP